MKYFSRLTKKAFRSWLTAKNRDQWVGNIDECHQTPIARFLYDSYQCHEYYDGNIWPKRPRVIQVLPQYIVVVDNGRNTPHKVYYAMPFWVEKFNNELSNIEPKLIGSMYRYVCNREQALAALEKC